MRESALEELVGGEEGSGELGAQAAVEGDGHAREEAGTVGRDEASQLGDVFRAAEATDRDLRPVELGVGREAQERGRLDRARADGNRTHAVPTVLDRGAAGEADDAGLGAAVRGPVTRRAERGVRRGV